LIEYSVTLESGETEIVAVALTDSLSDGLSMVYSFFNPEHAKRSIGSFMILDHIHMARQVRLPYVYLGYWVQDSPKMDYKANFTPLETFRNGQWRNLQEREATSSSESFFATDPISDQVAAIHLPKT